MKSCAILFNVQAGALRLSPDLKEIKSLAREVGLKADYYQPSSPGEMARQISQLVAQGAKKIVVAGGDGTVALAAQVLAHQDSALGIIPLGTANNFATALRLPQDLPSALRVIKHGEVKRVSLGQIGNTYFTEAAGVGLFADALALYGKGSNKNLLRALYAFTRLLLAFPRHRLKITLDGKSTVDRALLCTVANTYRFGTAYPVAPNARLTDDHLDVVVVSEMRRRELLSFTVYCGLSSTPPFLTSPPTPPARSSWSPSDRSMSTPTTALSVRPPSLLVSPQMRYGLLWTAYNR